MPGLLFRTDYISHSQSLSSANEFVNHGAKALILHYLGDNETEAEIQSLKREIISSGVDVQVVPGDIADPATATKVVLKYLSRH